MSADQVRRQVVAVTNMYPTSTSPYSGVFVAEQIESLRALGIPIEVLHIRRDLEGRSVYKGLAGQLRLMGALEGSNLVHVMYGGVMADRVTASAQGPTVVSFCGSDLNGEPEGRLVKRFIASYGVRASHRSARRATAIIVKSKGLARVLPPAVDQRKVFIVPNGVDLGVFKPLNRDECRRTLGWNRDRCHALFYARGPGKRPQLAREGVRLANLEGIGVELHEMADIPHEEVPVWMNAADVLLCTSVREGSPNTVKEALACGLPVVSVDVGDVVERIGGIEECILVPPQPSDIAMAIKQVRSRERRVDPSAISNLSLGRVAQRILNVYDYAIHHFAATGSKSTRNGAG